MQYNTLLSSHHGINRNLTQTGMVKCFLVEPAKDKRVQNYLGLQLNLQDTYQFGQFMCSAGLIFLTVSFQVERLMILKHDIHFRVQSNTSANTSGRTLHERIHPLHVSGRWLLRVGEIALTGKFVGREGVGGNCS